MAPKRVLILGGTTEAIRLAEALAAKPDCNPVTSLAGRTRHPARVAGQLRTGGFGGPEGLKEYLTRESVEYLVDATHPFAEQITRHAAIAASAAGIPLLRLDRLPWQPQPGDRWIDAADAADAARCLPAIARRIFLAIGRQDLAPFSGRDGQWFLLRMIDPPAAPPNLSRFACVTGRGPFSVEAELALLREHGIDTIVSRNSGGDASYAKIAAGRKLGLTIVMIRRPAALPGDRAETVAEALEWLRCADLR